MFAHALRLQARTVLVSARRSATTQLLPRFSAVRPSSYLRLFSTFRPLCEEANNVYSPEELPSFRKTVPPSSTLWIGNLPFSVDEGEIREIFDSLGQVVRIQIGRTPDGRGRGFAHIEYASTQEASDVLEALRDDPRTMQGRPIKVDFAPPRMRAVSEPYHVLYVSGFIGDEQELRGAFKEYESNILGVRLLVNPMTGEPQGAGFVDFLSIEHATNAMQALQDAEYAPGTTLKLSYARPRPQRRDRGGYGQEQGGYGQRQQGGYGQGQRGGYGQGQQGGYGRGQQGGSGRGKGGYGRGRDGPRRASYGGTD